jgi:hypothetical protein
MVVHCGLLAGLGQPGGGELADGLQQPVADHGAGLDLHDGLAGQAGQQPRDSLGRQRPAAGDSLGRVEIEPSPEHRQAGEQPALGVIEQLEAPRHQRLQ